VKDTRLDRDKLSAEEKCLVAPCGIFCGACDSYLGKSSELAQEMHRILDGFNIIDASLVAGFEQEKMADFMNILKAMGQTDKCTGCLGGGCKVPACPIKGCAQEKGFLTCAECDKMPCNKSQELGMSWEMITKRYSHWNVENLQRIREVGYPEFIDSMQKKVKSGFMTGDVISKEMVITEMIKKMQGQG